MFSMHLPELISFDLLSLGFWQLEQNQFEPSASAVQIHKCALHLNVVSKVFWLIGLFL